MDQPWVKSATSATKNSGTCATCGPKADPELLAAFDKIGARVISKYGRHISPEKKKPGYLGQRTQLLSSAEFRKAYLKETAKNRAVLRAKQIAKFDKERAQKLAAAARASSLGDQERLAAEAHKDYAHKVEWLDRDLKLAESGDNMNSHFMNGFVSEDGELFVNMDSPNAARTAQHEVVHKLASPAYHSKIDVGGKGHNLDEAITEYFTQQAGFPRGEAGLRAEYGEGSELVRGRYSDGALARAYFGGDLSQMEREYPVAKTIEEFNARFK